MFISQKCHYIFLLEVLGAVFLIQGSSSNQPNSCQSMSSCGSCLSSPAAECHWCSDTNYGLSEHCDLLDNLLHNSCPRSHIVNPNSSIRYDQNTAPRNARGNREAVQLSPQEVTIKLLPNRVITFPLTFRQAENYPVDMYFLMDMSNTMKPYKETLANLSQVLASNIKDITTDFQLGFGSFVDKTTMPYVSMTYKYSPTDPAMEAAYSYRNQLSLTSNVTEFEIKVKATKMSANLDDPEGGFEAIVQALACKNEIGWRKNSRKLIVFFTSSKFHYAGDGLLGGAVLPNDGHCHLDGQGYYTESLEQDYPSISQLIQIVEMSKVNVIFAVTMSQTELYTRLSAFIEGSSVGLLNDTEAVVRIVHDSYHKISSSIELKTEDNENVLVTYQTSCLGDVISDVPRCQNMSSGKSVTFDVTVQVLTCPTDGAEGSRTIHISPIGLSEMLTIHLDIVCECDCEKTHNEEPNSEQCNKDGTLECGVCLCNSGYYGNSCQCNSTTLDNPDHVASCIKPQSSLVCEDHGTCECGECKCSPVRYMSGGYEATLRVGGSNKVARYSGTYCQCNDYNCDLYDTMLCGGPSRGACRCSQCYCQPDYTGADCSCHNVTKPCTDSNGGICNNKGECVCGECFCNLDSSYKGSTCEVCPTCQGKCDFKKDCVLCHFLPEDDEHCDQECSGSEVKMVDEIQVSGDNWQSCQFREESCDIIFVFNQHSDVVIIQKTKECSEGITSMMIIILISIIIGVITIIGILCLLVWKILVTARDRREYARFKQEEDKRCWTADENPLFTEATTTSQNPNFRGKKIS